MASRSGSFFPAAPNLHGRTSASGPTHAKIGTAIDALYDAAGDTDLLPRAMERVTTCLGGHRANLLVRPGNTFAATPLFFWSHEIDTEILSLVAQQHYWERDLWSQSADRMDLTKGQVVLGEQLVEDATLRSSEFYADVLGPLEITRLIVGVADKTADDIVHFSAFAHERRGTFNEDDQRAMATLLPAIRVAVRSVLQLQHFKLRATALEETLDNIPEAAFLLDLHGKVLKANAAAEALTACQGDLIISKRGLTSRRASETIALQEMLRSIALPGTAPEPVVLRNELGQPALVITAVPLRSAEQVRREPQRADVAIAAVFATPAQSLQPAPSALLSSLYGLTPAEARLAESLAAGRSLAAFAEQFSIARDTARSQLKTVFRKTGTNRQSDLVALVLSIGSRYRR